MNEMSKSTDKGVLVAHLCRPTMYKSGEGEINIFCDILFLFSHSQINNECVRRIPPSPSSTAHPYFSFLSLCVCVGVWV